MCKYGFDKRLPYEQQKAPEGTVNRLQSNYRGGSVRSASLLSALTAAALIGLGCASTAAAQVAPQPPIPQISVNSRGEVQVAPDRARILVGIETRAKTAAVAASENSTKQTAILTAIKALGIPAAQITTMNFSVSPLQRYDEKDRRMVIDGYQVSNIVQVITDKLEQTGPIIDASLAAGANRVAGLDFMLKDPSKARDAALSQAVEAARRQAEVAAKAAGGSLGELLELNVNEYERPMPREVMAMSAKMDAAAAPTPISEGTTTVSISVGTRWRFVK